MDERLEPADGARRTAFLAYCAAHGEEHDESFIPGEAWPEDLEHPAFVMSAGESVVGAAAAILTKSYRNARKARFAILHALGNAEDAARRYSAMAKAIARSSEGLADRCYLFIPEGRAEVRSALESIGFLRERTAYLLGRGTEEPGTVLLPDGFRLEAVPKGDGPALEEFVAVRNRNFREVLGSSDAFAEDFSNIMESPQYIPGGFVLVRAPDGSACGTLLVEHDDEEGAGFVGTVSVDSAVRGRGLARALIRQSVRICGDNGLRSVFLSVNAENGKALPLYLNEGFTLRKAMLCLSADLRDLLAGRKARAPLA